MANPAASTDHTPSPGNDLYPDFPPMRAPHLEYVYRLVAKMHRTAGYEILQPQGIGVSRSIGHIQSGSVKGPRISGVVVENSGADWAERLHADHIYYRLDARYAIRTDDGYHIFVQARGLFQPGPVENFVYDPPRKMTYTQDEVEYFTHITFEAPGDSPYNWMNSIVAIGVLSAHDGHACIDCWRLTNFPGKEVRDVTVAHSSTSKPCSSGSSEAPPKD